MSALHKSNHTDDWERALRSQSIDGELAKRWASYARPHLTIEATPASGPMPAGTSRLGGIPDLPPEQDWPRREAETKKSGFFGWLSGSPRGPVDLSFLGQINLGDVAAFDTGLPLPETGLLQFYYDLRNQPWGFDPKDADGFKVLYIPETDGIKPAEAALREPTPVHALTFSAGSSIPDETWIHEKLAKEESFSKKTLEGIFKDRDEDEQTGEGAHQLGGWPTLIQNPMELECQLVSNGIYCGTPSGYTSQQAQQLESGADDWRLMLQLQSDETLEWMWGDLGTLYFWCREQDIAESRFERSWTILQCT